MSNNISIEDIVRLMQAGQGGQELEQSLEQLLMSQLLNPVQVSTARTLLANISRNGVISECREGSIINSAGVLEDIKEVKVYMLDDGTSTSGIVRCQTCGGIVSEKNLKRCDCGRTCCVRPGCGKYLRSKDSWYCCRKHAVLGFLGLNLSLK